MTDAEAITRLQIGQWASRQLADYDARDPGTIFGEDVLLNITEAYQLQSAVAQLRQKRGEQIVGYKVGCTSPAIRQQLGIDHCVSGRLFSSEQHQSGAELSRADFANLAIEGELAVELAREPDENVDDLSGNTIPDCVAKIIPVIELHHLVMRGKQASAAELIANNAIHAGVVAGQSVKPEEFDEQTAMEIYVDDQLIDQYRGPLLCQTIGTSLKWLAKLVRERGELLKAGEIILTGAIPSLIPINQACSIRVEAPPFGRVEATVI